MVIPSTYNLQRPDIFYKFTKPSHVSKVGTDIVLNVQELNASTPYGLMKGEPVKIHLKDVAKPFHCNTARRIPVPLLPKVKNEFERMQNAGVIQKISGPTEWCSPIVVVPKSNGQIRICVDLR